MMPRRSVSLLVILCLGSVARSQEPGDHPFSGRVVDESAKPVGGAAVRLLSLKTIGNGEELEVDRATRTDAEGRFQLAVPKSWLRMTPNYRQELSIVAVHDGRMAGLLINRSALPPKTGTLLQFTASPETTIAVRSPAGAPVPGALVKIVALQTDQVDPDLTEKDVAAYAEKPRRTPNGYATTRPLALPPDLYTVVGKTDDGGLVKVSRFAARQIGGVLIDSAEFGEQSFMPNLWSGRKAPPDWPAKITLQPVGRVQGQLTGTPQAIANREVTLATHIDVKDMFCGGRAKVRTDAEGKLEARKLASGAVHVRLAFDPKTPDRLSGADKPVQLKAGAALELKLAVKPAVRLTGVVLNAETRKAVADVYVIAGSEGGATSTMTDADGKFTVWVAPGKASIMPLIPEGFLDPISPDQWGSPEHGTLAIPKEIDVAGDTFEAPPVLLMPEATLRGVVLDERGQPIAGAAVSAISRIIDRRRGGPANRETTVRTDERGEFSIGGLDPRVAIRLRAQAQDASKVVTVAKLGKEQVRIAIGTKQVFRIEGRVVDAKGQAVADASLEIWHRDWRPPPTEAEPKKLALKEALRTDANGNFATPSLLPDGHYRFVIRAAGVKTTESAWLDATLPEATAAQELVVTRLGGLAGVLRDRQGKPVADAQVALFSRDLQVATASNAKGEFQLEIPGGKPFCVIARHPDFRAHGVTYDKDPAQLDQTLTRLAEPADKRAPRTILAKEERHKLLQQLLAPYKEKLPKQTSQDELYRAATVLAQADPGFLLTYLDKNPLKPALMHDSALLMIVKRWAKGQTEDAEELIGKLQTPYVKAMALCDLADGMPAKARAKRLETLAEALVAARTEKSPEFRAIVLGFVGRRLFDLDEKERAATVLREGAKLAEGLSTSAYAAFARGNFATDLALIDLPAALALVKDLKDASEFRRHHGNIAHRIAAMQPAAAVKVLDLIPGPKANEFNQRDHYGIRVCYRMATVDVPKSLAVADSIIDGLSRAQAFGVIAQAAAPKDAKLAAELLRRAYVLLEEDAQKPDPAQLTTPLTQGSVAAVLIFNAAQIDSALVDECLWRAVALQRPPSEDPQKVWRYQTGNCALAMAAARYNAKLAELLLPPPSKVMQARETLLAQFLVTPQRTALAAGKLSSPQEVQQFAQLIGYLATPEDQLPRLIHRTLGIWPIDAEDIDF